MRMRWLAVLFAACTQTGTISVSLVESPNSTLLDGVQTLQLTLTDPLTSATATRIGSGFAISISVDANESAGQLIAEGMDGGGNVLAVGESPLFPVDALDASIAIFMAPPNSVTASTVVLDPAVDEVGVGQLSYGVVLAGGRDASGAPSDVVTIYDAYSQAAVQGTALPAARAGLAIGVEAGTYVFMFGGTDANGSAQANDWYLDTSASTAGVFSDFGAKPGFERTGQAMVQVDADDFMLTGAPAAELSDLTGLPTARTDVSSLPAAGAVTTGSDGNFEAIFIDGSAVTRYRDANDTFDTLTAPGVARDGASVVALPTELVGVFCGGTISDDAATIDPVSGAVVDVPGVPSVARTSGCAVAATDQILVIAGGMLADGSGVATTVEIFDAVTLAPIATAPLVVPRTNATAIPLGNGQVVIAGGDDATGAPIATIELVTPMPVIP
jgi:hypothetical protein